MSAAAIAPAGVTRARGGFRARSRIFALIIAYLGLYHLLAVLSTWRPDKPARLLGYSALVIGCWLWQRRRFPQTVSFPLSLPVVLLAVVDLNHAEALTVGCLAALLQSLYSGSLRDADKRLLLLYFIGVQAMMIATARFAIESLLPPESAGAPLQLLVAAVALFVANTLPPAIAARLDDGERLGRIVRVYAGALPHYLVAAAGAHLLRLGPKGLSWDMSLLILTVLALTYRQHRIQKAQLNIRQKQAEDMAVLHLRAIEGLAVALEAKENSDIAGHLRRVRVYAVGVGRAMGMSKSELDALHAAALLHDIGKLAVPDHILTKPGKLTADEFARLKVHTLVGAEIVEHVQFPYPVAPLVRAHHEKWDGSGYPFGLKEEEIPLGARILSAVDCLDALASDREYRKAMPLEAAVRHVVGEAGRSFDPAVTRVLERTWKDLEQQVKLAEKRPLMPAEAPNARDAAPDAGLDPVGGALAAGAGFISTIAAARREEQRLREINLGIGESLGLERTLERLHELLSGILPYDALAVFLRQANVLRMEFVTGVNQALLSGLEVEIGEGLTGWVAQQQQAVVNGNPAVDPGFTCEPESALESALAFPLTGSEGVFAVLTLYRKQRDAFCRDDLRILNAVAPRISTALEHALAFRRAERQTNTDDLTGLPNREGILRVIQEEISRCRRSQTPAAVAIIRLTGAAFPVRRHAAAPLLSSIGQVFRRDCRDYDSVGYVEPNTFAFVLPGMKAPDLPEKLNGLTNAATTHLGSATPTAFETGSAFYPDDTANARQLLSQALRRASLFHGSATGPGQWEKSVQSLGERLDDGQGLTVDLNVSSKMHGG